MRTSGWHYFDICVLGFNCHCLFCKYASGIDYTFSINIKCISRFLIFGNYPYNFILCTINKIFNRAIVDDHAASLIDRQMTLIDCMGIDAFVESGQTQGEFGDMAPDYSWTLFTESLGIDSLYEVTLTVTWPDRGGVKSLSATTRLNGQSVLVTSDLNEE